MKHIYKRISLVLAAALMLLFAAVFPNDSKGEFNMPDTIRVGLYFTDSSVHISTATSAFTVCANAGLEFGFTRDNAFVEIYDAQSPALFSVRKDAYYSDAGGALKEYNPQSGNIPGGNRFGPYHIKIGTDFPDQASASVQATAYRQQNIMAYPVYADTWQVWYGFYTDEISAQQDIANSLGTLTSAGVVLTVIQPAANRIVVADGSNQPLCLFGSDTAFFRIFPRPDNNPDVLSINGKPYRGLLEVRRLTGSDMTVINVVNLEEYLYGNVPPEIGGKSPAEALKAQAIASKMYAIGNIGKHKKQGFDITATTNDQVYNGYSAEVPSCNTAIDSVRDKVLTYGGNLAGEVFYFASSGGRTEDSVNVFGMPVPYLKSVEDRYDPINTWTKTLRASDVKARVTGIGNILGMDITKTSESGRVTQLAVRGDQSGNPSVFSLDRCRTVFSLDSQLYTINTDADIYVAGADANPSKTQMGGKSVITSEGVKKLDSSNNKVSLLGSGGSSNVVALVPETYTFTGKGWGHAVGMSQDGAIGMGKAGIAYADILEHYFYGTKVE